MNDAEREIHIRRLQPLDDRSRFCSGNIELDRFFQRFAGQNQFRHHIGTTYVAVQGHRVTGFVTVSSGELLAEKLAKSLRKRLPSYPLPILRVARLAVDERFQGHGIGKLLLRAMLLIALEMRERVGCIGIVVDAKPDAVAFYSDLGFKPMELVSGALKARPEPIAMFLSTRQIEVAISLENVPRVGE